MIFRIYRYDALREYRVSIYISIGWQNQKYAAKYWLESAVELARSGRTLPSIDQPQQDPVTGQLCYEYAKQLPG